MRHSLILSVSVLPIICVMYLLVIAPDVQPVRQLRLHGTPLAVSNNGELVADYLAPVLGFPGKLTIRKLSSGEVVRSQEIASSPLYSSQFVGKDTLVTFDNAGRHLAWAYRDNIQKTLGDTGDTVRATALTRNSEKLAIGGDRRDVSIYSLPDFRHLQVLRGHTDTVRAVSFSADASLLLSAGDDKIARIWNVKSGECMRELAGHRDRIWAVAFGSDGKLAATGSLDGKVRLWNATSGRLEREFDAGKEGISAIAFSPGGTLLAAADYGSGVRIWSTATGDLHCVLQRQKYPSRFLIFVRGDNDLMTAGPNYVNTWDIRPPAIKTRNGRNSLDIGGPK